MSLVNTPQSMQVHIGLFGKMNVGKSTLMNKLLNQNMSIVSDVSGTTTDIVQKSMELNPIGPVVFIDCAGYDDDSLLGKKRIEKTMMALEKSDLCIFIFTSELEQIDYDWILKAKNCGKKIIPIINKCDELNLNLISSIEKSIKNKFSLDSIKISLQNSNDVIILKDELVKMIPESYEKKSFTGSLCSEGDEVFLVMSQDIQAPKGRLILPQVQILRELLDKKCIVSCCSTDNFEQTLDSKKRSPSLIICDSQVFNFVYEKKPESSLLTSFSALLAANKGDINDFILGAEVVKNIQSISKVLISESCTHSPLEEDIGREKIPRMLRSKNPTIKIDFVSGKDFPSKLVDDEGNKKYDLIIHCGACMFNSAFVRARQIKAKDAEIPMTNYGIFIAAFLGILDKIVFPS